MKEQIRACLAALEVRDAGFRAVFRFPADLEVFAGHFPGLPLLPGVFLIEATRYAAERATGRRLAIRRIEEAKFTAEVPPGGEATVEAALTRGEDGWWCDAAVSCAQVPAARVRLGLGEETGP
jgi:3-hydroxyacyl-[acyl-carrier-protein] dehydratase